MRPFSFALILIAVVLTRSVWSAETLPSGVRARPLQIPTSGKTGFTLLGPELTGVTFTNSLAESASVENRVLNNGSGVAAGDFNNDGLTDLFFCSLHQGNRLFKNLGGWKFEDVTESAGLRFPALYYHAAVFADVNGDGWLDLLVGSVGRGVFCFLNDRQGNFIDATREAGTATPFANQTLALADIDANGTLDLYVCNNRNDDIRDWPRVPIMFVNKKPTVPPQLQNRLTVQGGVLQEFGEPDLLYLNDGRGRFAFASWTNGAFFDEQGMVLTNTPLDWGLAAAFRDLNNDGAPDLYVCNDYWTPDRVWINGGRGRFKEIGTLAVRKIPISSMGADFADINRDGHLDIFAVDMLSRSSELRRRQAVAKTTVPSTPGPNASRIQAPRNTLLLNRGDGTFAEIACFAGLEASEWSWSPLFLDVDLDGYDDLLITSGHVRDIQDLDANDAIRAQQESWRRTPMAATNLNRAFTEAKRQHARLYPPLNMPVIAFRNRGDLRFEEKTDEWGFNSPGVNHGAALADFDDDGDLDLVVNRLGSPAALFRNDTTAPRIAVRLRGKSPNTQAIGARIELVGAISNQVHEVASGGHYMSGSDTLRVFATTVRTAATNHALSLRITWRDRSVTEVNGVTPGHQYEIDESTAARVSRSERAPDSTRWFEEVSALVQHRHEEEPFDDFARQPMLPRKLSQAGPGVSWFDADGDGWEDLIIGAGRGASPALFMSRHGKSFSRATNGAWSAPVVRDQTTLLGWGRSPSQRSLLAGSSTHENSATNLPMVEVFNFTSGRAEARIAGLTPGGPLALADVDGNGELELFIGAASRPGRYPEAADSLLLRHDAGRWTVDATNSRQLANVGVVNGALWSDLDSDGFPELVLACEWGPLRIFQNREGKLTPATSAWGLERFTGLWQSVAAGDFDGDGRLDLVAGNWGLNSCWRAAEQPLTIFYGDLSGRGTMDILETEFSAQRRELVPRSLRDEIAPSVPWITAKFPTHAAWSRATAAEVMAGAAGKMNSVSVTRLETTVFLNRNGRFEARPLPAEAQFAPTFGVCVADFDADGREDIFLAQNFFAFRVEDTRLDASRGLLLRGDGKGNFQPVPGHHSGIRMFGEQRGAAVADFDHDGRVDLAVGQNGSETKLFRNVNERRGIRIRLIGPPGNLDGIGALIRLRSDEQWGAVREIHSGSGYWSQDGAVTVLSGGKEARALEVRWPGGHRTEMTLTGKELEIEVRR